MDLGRAPSVCSVVWSAAACSQAGQWVAALKLDLCGSHELGRGHASLCWHVCPMYVGI